MRTTLDLPPDLLALAKVHAAAHHRTLREVVIASLQGFLAAAPPKASPATIRLPSLAGTGGLHPGVDLLDSSALLDLD